MYLIVQPRREISASIIIVNRPGGVLSSILMSDEHKGTGIAKLSLIVCTCSISTGAIAMVTERCRLERLQCYTFEIIYPTDAWFY